MWLPLAWFACSYPDYAEFCDRDGVTCDELTVPSDWDDPTADELTVRYAVLAADAPDGTALTLINGGPSNSSIDAFGMMMEGGLGDAVRAHHDVVLVDQRGIPHSEPSLACPELQDTYEALFAQDLPFLAREQARVDALVACRDRLSADGVDLNDYTSPQAARDLAAVLAHLGYDQYGIWGVSYGTLLAQHVLRVDPDHVSALVLDSVAPIDVNILQEAPRSASLAWDAIDQACRDDAKCAGKYPDVKGALQGAIAAHEADPVALTSVNPYDGTDYTWTLDGDALALIAVGAPMMGVPAYLPWYTYDVAGGNTDRIARDGVTDLWYDPTSVDLWTYTFRCSEQASLDPAAPASADTWPEMDHAFRPVLEQIPPACNALGLVALPEDVHDPVGSEVPTLMFSGQADPVTPPWMAAHLAETLPNSTIVSLPLTGHMASLSPCAWDAIGAFLDDPSSAGSVDCAAQTGEIRRTGCDSGGPGRMEGVALAGMLALAVSRRRGEGRS